MNRAVAAMEVGPPGSPWRRRAQTNASRAGAGPARSGARERTGSGGHREGRSSGAGDRGGRAQSSGEGPVMGLETRSRADQGHSGASPQGEEPRDRPGPKVKSFEIGKRLIVEAWEKVRASNGAPAVDAVAIGLFAPQLRDTLDRLWNRFSPRTYFPAPLRAA